MTNPFHNIWFLLGIALTVVSIAIRASTDKSHNVNVWYVGLNYGIVTAIAALVCLIHAIMEIKP